MNKEVFFEGKWKQIRETKAWWGKLTDDDVERAAGKIEVFAALLQKKYGYTRDQAVDEIDRRITEYESKLKESTASTS